MTWARVMIAIALLASVVSCKRLEDKIVGEWQSEDQQHSVTFKDDGTAVFTSYGRSVTAHYKFTDAKHMRIDFDNPYGELSGTQIATVAIEKGDKEQLSLEFESGFSRSYLRYEA